MTSICPLCISVDTCQVDSTDRIPDSPGRTFIACACCGLVHVPSQFYPTRSEEQAVYDFHENRVDDPAYRSFLSRLFDPLTELIPVGAKGLDFGCGSGPALAAMLRERGHSVDLYDSFYVKNSEVFHRNYQFITSTEVFEHLQRPRQEIERLWNCLEPGGFLGVMTKRIPAEFSSMASARPFSDWFYVNDPTHICFFSDQTFHWLAEWLNAELRLIRNDVAILQKSATAA